jgi:hypothetical protein
MRVPQSTVPVDRSAPECGRTPGPTSNPMPAVPLGDDLRSADARAERAVGTDVVAGSERKPVPTGATGRDRCSAASMMPGCASRTVGRWRTPLQVIPRTQWAKGARHRTHLAYLVRLVTPAARTTRRPARPVRVRVTTTPRPVRHSKRRRASLDSEPSSAVGAYRTVRVPCMLAWYLQ